jgi:CheY-like chemotaxis protein
MTPPPTKLEALLCPDCRSPIVAAFASEYVSDGSVRHRWICDHCDCAFCSVVHDGFILDAAHAAGIGAARSRIRVTLADDHPIVLSGLRSLIQAQPDLELVGEASDGLFALELIKEQKPDIAVLDISMPNVSGLNVARRLSHSLPSVRFIALTLHEGQNDVEQAFDAGMRGYVLKRSAAENIDHAIRQVFDVGLYLDPGLGHSMAFKGESIRQAAARCV